MKKTSKSYEQQLKESHMEEEKSQSMPQEPNHYHIHNTFLMNDNSLKMINSENPKVFNVTIKSHEEKKDDVQHIEEEKIIPPPAPQVDCKPNCTNQNNIDTVIILSDRKALRKRDQPQKIF